jgi:hypothetical protein
MEDSFIAIHRALFTGRVMITGFISTRRRYAKFITTITSTGNGNVMVNSIAREGSINGSPFL